MTSRPDPPPWNGTAFTLNCDCCGRAAAVSTVPNNWWYGAPFHCDRLACQKTGLAAQISFLSEIGAGRFSFRPVASVSEFQSMCLVLAIRCVNRKPWPIPNLLSTPKHIFRLADTIQISLLETLPEQYIHLLTQENRRLYEIVQTIPGQALREAAEKRGWHKR